MKRLLIACLLLPFHAHAAPDLEPNWSAYPGFFAPGYSGIATLDIDGDGNTEAVVTGSLASPFGIPGYGVLAVVSATDGQQFRIRSLRRLPVGEFIVGRIVAFRHSSGQDRIAAVLESGNSSRLVQLTGPRLEESASVSVPAGFSLNGVADIDGLPGLEAIGCACSQSNSRPGQMLDLETGAVIWTGTQSGWATEAGQLDADPQLEIVVAGDQGVAGHVLDGASRQLQWSWPDGFKGRVAIGNFRNQSPGNELAIVEGWGSTHVFVTSPVFSPVSSVQTGEVQSIAVADVNGDGLDELFTGAGQWGSIRAYNLETGQILHTVANPEHGTSALAVARMGLDNSWQVIHGAGLTSTGRDIVRVAELATGLQRWIQADESGPHSSVVLAPLSATGTLEAAYLTLESNSGYDGHNLVVLDVSTGQELRRRLSVLESWGNNTGAHVLAAQLDADPQFELILGSQYLYDSIVRVVDGESLETQWTSSSLDVDFDEGMGAIAALPGSSPTQLIAAVGGRLSFLSAGTGAVLSTSPIFAVNGHQTLVVADMDGDPALEIGYGTGSLIRIIDFESRLVEATIDAGTPILGQRVERDANACLHVLTYANRIERRFCMSGALHSTRMLSVGNATYVGFPESSTGPLVLSDGSRMILDVDGTPIVQTKPLGMGLGWRNRGAITRDNGEVHVLAGSLDAVHYFELVPRLFSDSFEQ